VSIEENWGQAMNYEFHSFPPGETPGWLLNAPEGGWPDTLPVLFEEVKTGKTYTLTFWLETKLCALQPPMGLW